MDTRDASPGIRQWAPVSRSVSLGNSYIGDEDRKDVKFVHEEHIPTDEKSGHVQLPVGQTGVVTALPFVVSPYSAP